MVTGDMQKLPTRPFAKRKNGMRPPHYFRTLVDAAVPKMGEMAHAKIPPGVCRFVASDVDYAEWFFAGTSFTPGQPLPDAITVREDLTLTANFSDHFGAEGFVKYIVKNARLPVETDFWKKNERARNAAAILLNVAENGSRENPYLTFEIAERAHFSLVVRAHEALGEFGTVLEHAGISYLLNLAEIAKPSRASLYSPVRPILVMRGPEPDWSEALPDALRCRKVWQANFTAMVLPRSWGVMSSSPSHAELDTLDPDGFAMSVDALREMIFNHLQQFQRCPRLKEVAQASSVSERTMARRLAQMGATYQQVLDSCLMEASTEQLRDPDKSVREISEALGYLDSATFGRAFRRWFGKSPVQWRIEANGG